MANNNIITLIGNLGKDPLTYTSDNHKKYVGVTLCVTDSYKNDAGEWIDKKPQWFFVSFLGDIAQGYARNFRKGQRVKITGQLSSYDVSTVDGDTEMRLSVVGRRIEFAALPKRNDAVATTADAASVSSSSSV